MGKDLTKIALPVYFNDTSGMLQRTAAAFEYTDILDRASKE